MRILFLHGLEGELSESKREHLLTYGEVISPKLDYRTDSSIIQTMAELYTGQAVDVIIGSSLGGFTGYYLSLLLKTPSLIFNPALPYRSVEQMVPNALPPRNHYLQVVLGNKDEVIRAIDTQAFLSASLTSETNARIHLVNQLPHRIPLSTFQQEVDIFFSCLKYE